MTSAPLTAANALDRVAASRGCSVERGTLGARLLTQLTGARIMDAGCLVEGGEAWPVLLLGMANGNGQLVLLEVAQDDEGNGPGAVFVGPAIEEVER